MRSRALSLSMSILILFFVPAPPGHASTSINGKSCVKKGSIQIVGKTKFLCLSIGSRLIWSVKSNKAISSSGAPQKTPSPQPTISPQSQPSRSPSPNLMKDGTFNGSIENSNDGYVWGPLQVQITVLNGHIISVQTLEISSAPKATDSAPLEAWKRNRDLIIAMLIDQTLRAQSETEYITGVPGAEAASIAWYDSLLTAVANAKAGITAGNENPTPSPLPSPTQPTISLQGLTGASHIFSNSAINEFLVSVETPSDPSASNQVAATIVRSSGETRGVLMTLKSGTQSQGTWALDLPAGFPPGDYISTFTLTTRTGGRATCQLNFTITS